MQSEKMSGLPQTIKRHLLPDTCCSAVIDRPTTVSRYSSQHCQAGCSRTPAQVVYEHVQVVNAVARSDWSTATRVLRTPQIWTTVKAQVLTLQREANSESVQCQGAFSNVLTIVFGVAHLRWACCSAAARRRASAVRSLHSSRMWRACLPSVCI
jgi:hypothetical protein